MKKKKIFFWFFYEYFSFSLWDPMGAKNSKRYSPILQIAAKSFQTFLESSSQWSSQNWGGNFWNFEFPIFNKFLLKNFKFTIVAYGEIKNLNHLENERSDRRAKQSEIWDSWVIRFLYMGYLWPFSMQGHFEVIRCTCDFPKMQFPKDTISSTNHSQNLSNFP